jgi:sterol desaturase/sphingolipid hydroxylase (fatty acid hydroxylase superfamily)
MYVQVNTIHLTFLASLVYLWCNQFMFHYLVVLTGICLGHIIHRSGHNYKFKAWYKNHTVGHHKLSYPSDKFLQPFYIKNPVDDWKLATLAYVIPIGLYCFIFANLVVFLILVLDGIIENYIHEQIHQQNSWLEKYRWFSYLRSIHRLHHDQTRLRSNQVLVMKQCNFSLLALWTDQLFGTFVENGYSNQDKK